MRLRLIEEYVNKTTIVFHGTAGENLPTIIKNGLGGQGKEGASQMWNTPEGSDEYITRHLGVALEYAYNNGPANPLVLALQWSKPGTEFQWDHDEASLPQDQYARSNYAAPASNLKVIYAWKLPPRRSRSPIVLDPSVDRSNPGPPYVVGHDLYYAGGDTAIRWLDKFGSLVYNAYGQ